jgi:hypothetical protein
MNYQSDTDHKLKLNYLDATLRKYGFFKGIIVWLFNSFLRAAAFSIQCILRFGIGRASFGVLTILFSYLWISFFVFGDLSYSFEPEEYYNSRETVEEFDQKIMPVYGGWAYLKQFAEELSFVDDAILNGPGEEGSKLVYIFSFIVVGLGIFNILYEQFIEESKKPNIDFRGESLLLYWLKRKKIQLPFDLMVFQRLIEPGLVFGIGFIILSTGGSRNFGLLLMFSSVALFIEELKAFNRDRIYNDPTRRQRTATTP